MDRLTPKDLVEVFNIPFEADTTRFLLYAQRLWEVENELESRRTINLSCAVGDWVYIIDNERHWAKITDIHISTRPNGAQKITYEWAQCDVGPDITELWDADEFDSEEIGKTVLLEKEHEGRIKELQEEEEKKFEEYEALYIKNRNEFGGEE